MDIYTSKHELIKISDSPLASGGEGEVREIISSPAQYKGTCAKIYYQQYGHSEIVNTFKTTNGIDYDENGFYLGYWCFEQRNRYQKKLLEERKKYIAYISINNKPKRIGSFDTIEEAAEARLEAEFKYYGEFRYDSDNKHIINEENLHLCKIN